MRIKFVVFVLFFAITLILVASAQEAEEQETVVQPASQQDVKSLEEKIQILNRQILAAEKKSATRSQAEKLEIQKAQETQKTMLVDLQKQLETAKKEAVAREKEQARQNWVMMRNVFVFFGAVILVIGVVFCFKLLKSKKPPILIDPDIPQLKEYSVKYKTKKVPFFLLLKEGDKFECVADLRGSEVITQIGQDTSYVPWKKRMAHAAEIAHEMKKHATI